MAHKHAALMALYAQDAMETDKPWERWESKTSEVLGWADMLHHPALINATSYRHKQKMLSVTLANGEVVSWPEPQRTELEYGDPYFYFTPTHTAILCLRSGTALHGIETHCLMVTYI